MLHLVLTENVTVPVIKKKLRNAACLPLLFALGACGGSGSDSDTVSENQNTDTERFITNFTLNISDAPVDNASEVMVYFREVELIGNGDPIIIDVSDSTGSPRMIDLLTLQGEKFVNLIDDFEIPSGQYSHLRMVIEEDSYIVMDSGTYPLSVPGQKLKLDGFVAEPQTDQTFTVEFDLRKSLVNPVGKNEVFLKPRGVRLVRNDTVGTLLGRVSMGLINDADCMVKADAHRGNAVYLYEGMALDTSMLGDDADLQSGEIRPVTSANVIYDDTADTYNFTLGYVPAGDYTLAFSCLAYQDEPETDEDFEFQAVEETVVVAGETTPVTFN